MAEKLSDIAEDDGGRRSNLTPDAFLAAYRQMRQAKREQGEAAASVARAGKRLKSIGVDRRAYELFERLMDLDIDEAKTVIESALTYARWANHPVQLDLFGRPQQDEPSDDAQREFAEFDVEDRGYAAGFSGEKIESNPYNPETPNSPAYALWRTGWHNGQAARVHKAFGGKPEESEADQTTNPQPGRRPGRPRRQRNEQVH